MSISGMVGKDPGRRSALAVSAFASIGHTFTHLLTAFYFVIVLAIEKEWGRSYAELIQLWTIGSFPASSAKRGPTSSKFSLT